MRVTVAVLLQCILLCTQSVNAVNIEMVTVGNPGNAPDERYNLDKRPEGFGAVNYVYQIGKYEITAGQYTEFLNAVAKDDLNGLYFYAMDTGANILQSGSSPNYSYSVAPEFANRPVNYVNFWNAARFCNWLHNGQPIGPQGPETTENGAYHDIGSYDFGSNDLFGRNPDAKFFVPTEDEWYKAAYHDKTSGLVASYFDYPTGTDARPGRDVNEFTNPGKNANYSPGGAAYNLTVAGEFQLSDRPYGTFDQGGNVWEWNEMKVISSTRGLRGGSSLNNSSYLLASQRYHAQPSFKYISIGFRIAAAAPVPEPTCLAFISIAAVMLGGRRLRTRRDSRRVLPPPSAHQSHAYQKHQRGRWLWHWFHE